MILMNNMHIVNNAIAQQSRVFTACLHLFFQLLHIYRLTLMEDNTKEVKMDKTIARQNVHDFPRKVVCGYIHDIEKTLSADIVIPEEIISLCLLFYLIKINCNKYKHEYHLKFQNQEIAADKNIKDEDTMVSEPQLPDIQFFKQLEATLSKIGCTDEGKAKYFTTVRENIISNMIQSINNVKDRESKYELLPFITELTEQPNTMNAKQMKDRNTNVEQQVARENSFKKKNESKIIDFVEQFNDAHFTIRFNLEYQRWATNGKKFEEKFKNEISNALKICSSSIQIQNVKQGSIIIDYMVVNIWYPLYANRILPYDPIPAHYQPSLDDQIEVSADGHWYPATIKEIRYTDNGELIHVRYNPVNGKNAFVFVNTEWFNTLKEASRLRVPNQVLANINMHGAVIRLPFTSPPLAQVYHLYQLQPGHHISVDFKISKWYRCIIVSISHNMIMKVINLRNGKSKKLDLNDIKDQSKIRW
eukprot:522889_1